MVGNRITERYSRKVSLRGVITKRACPVEERDGNPVGKFY